MLEQISAILKDPDAILSEWERGFLVSIFKQSEAGHELSPSQVSVLSRIELNNSEKTRSELKRWKDNWTEEHSEIAKVVAHYYLHTGYFTVLASKIVFDDYTPTEKEYRKMCENKYALRVRSEHFKDPAYPVNSLVQVRKTNTINKNLRHLNGGYTKLSNSYAVVLEPNAAKITRAAAGSKVYKVLPFGSPKSYYVSEGDIKKARGVKK